MLKKVIKIKKIEQKQVNKNLLYFGLGFICILAVVGLVLNLNESSINPTGAAIHIKFYGVSDVLMTKYPGQIQTYVELKQPTLRTLSKPEGRMKVVQIISKKIDFTNAIVEIYKNKPFATISAGSINGVTTGSKKENSNFENDLTCLKKMGSNYRNRVDLKLALISELKYQPCRNKKGWHYAYMQHKFFDQGKGGIICRQEGGKLFSVDDNNGEVSTDTVNC
tara:strand:- start:1619 stop:2284 length:666 start_codon:yes stop_codon:yes gene_type:complete